MDDLSVARVEPQLEQYAGQNNPFRGTEQHGVPFEAEPYADPLSHDGVPVEYEAPEPAPDPVPVRIVQDSAQEVSRWDGATFPITEGLRALLIVGRNEKRFSLSITNEGPDPVYLSPTAAFNVGFAAVRLGAGGEFKLTKGAEVYAMTDNGAPLATLRVVQEYTVEG